MAQRRFGHLLSNPGIALLESSKTTARPPSRELLRSTLAPFQKFLVGCHINGVPLEVPWDLPAPGLQSLQRHRQLRHPILLFQLLDHSLVRDPLPVPKLLVLEQCLDLARGLPVKYQYLQKVCPMKTKTFPLPLCNVLSRLLSLYQQPVTYHLLHPTLIQDRLRGHRADL
jgi:hypothetical protein